VNNAPAPGWTLQKRRADCCAVLHSFIYELDSCHQKFEVTRRFVLPALHKRIFDVLSPILGIGDFCAAFG
jgi:hypothetical protein